jgi:DNA-nicking Smr family endonuclease
LNKKITDKDKKDWENFLSNNDKLPDKDIFSSNKKNNKIQVIDLHGFGLDDANNETERFIFDCYHKGFSKLRVVTGKGIHSQNYKDPYVSKNLGILKYSIPEFIKGNNNLMNIISSFESASIEDGGDGAFYIYLKKRK